MSADDIKQMKTRTSTMFDVICKQKDVRFRRINRFLIVPPMLLLPPTDIAGLIGLRIKDCFRCDCTGDSSSRDGLPLPEKKVALKNRIKNYFKKIKPPLSPPAIRSSHIKSSPHSISLFSEG